MCELYLKLWRRWEKSESAGASIGYSVERSFLILNCCCAGEGVELELLWSLEACELDTTGVDAACPWSSARMVAISFCINAHGTFDPRSGHLSPDGQYTSPAPVPPFVLFCCCCCLMDEREQGKQNLWEATEGHWTKCVSSSLSWHRVHFSGAGWVTGEAVDGGVVVFGAEWVLDVSSNLGFLFATVVLEVVVAIGGGDVVVTP